VFIKVSGREGQPRCSALGKIGRIDDVRAERQRGLHVAPLLLPRSCVPELRHIFSGAGNMGGVFYRFADEHNASLFARIASSPSDAEQLVTQLVELERPWQSGVTVSTLTVRDIRRLLLADDACVSLHPQFDGLDLQGFENRTVQVRRCVQHGDLHGENVLVDPQGNLLVIDYARAGESPASLDPITLELSLLSHSAGRRVAQGWPTTDAAAHWPVLERYTADCPVPAFVAGCRNWALSVANSPREIYAVAYAVALRQLKYEDTPHDAIRAIARAVIRAFSSA
jgi:hypothetical protein